MSNHPNRSRQTRLTVFSYLVPVYVTVVDGRVVSVEVDGNAPIENPQLVTGSNLDDAVTAAKNQSWPETEFGT